MAERRLVGSWDGSGLWLVLLVSAQGCYLSHGLGGASSPDGGSSDAVADARVGDSGLDADARDADSGDAATDSGDAATRGDAATDSMGRLDSGGAGQIPSDVARRLALAECEGVLPCQPINLGSGAFTTEADCVASVTHFFETEQLPLWEAAAEAGELTYDAAAFEACLATIRADGCGKLGVWHYRDCERAFRGRIPNGEACLFEFHCQPGSSCDRHRRGECPGVCTPNVALGEPCDTNFACGQEAFCGGGGCVPPLAEGETCAGLGYAGRECARGLVCDLLPVVPPELPTGTCRRFDSRLVGLDQPCDPELGPHCEGDLVCSLVIDRARGTEHQVCARPSARGGSCTMASPSACPSDQFCRGWTPGYGVGTCLSVPQRGEPCPDGRCGNGLTCRGPGSPTCQFFAGPGEVCDPDSSFCIGAGPCTTGMCPPLVCEARDAL